MDGKGSDKKAGKNSKEVKESREEDLNDKSTFFLKKKAEAEEDERKNSKDEENKSENDRSTAFFIPAGDSERLRRQKD